MSHSPDLGVDVCYRHRGRECQVRCVRCDRFICPDCMREAAVGYQCPQCVRAGNKGVRQARALLGGQAAGGRPVATVTLIFVTLALYLAELSHPRIADLLENLGSGMTAPDGHVFPAPPLPYWPSAATGPVHPVGVASGEWYRLLTSNFVHLPIADGGFVGVVGLLLSLTALWCLGSLLEELLGSGRLVALYVLCGLGGSVAEYVLAPEQESLGAAGAVCGLATAYFVLSRRLRQHRAAGNRLLTVWLIWMLLSAPFSSWQAYLGGLLTGGLLGAVLAFAPRRARGWAQAAGASAVLVLLVLVVAVQTHHLMTLGGRM